LGEAPAPLGEDFSLVSRTGIWAQSHKGTKQKTSSFLFPLHLCPFVPLFIYSP
jgi:hypothetical protein